MEQKLTEIISNTTNDFICFNAMRLIRNELRIYEGTDDIYFKDNSFLQSTMDGIVNITPFIKNNIKDIVDLITAISGYAEPDLFIVDTTIYDLLRTLDVKVLIKFIKFLASKICILSFPKNDKYDVLYPNTIYEIKQIFIKNDLEVIDHHSVDGMYILVLYNMKNRASLSVNKHIVLHTHGPKDGISSNLLNNGIWESTMTMAFLKSLEKGSGIMIDVGTHIGYYSMIAASKGFEVHSFEPLRYNYIMLELTILSTGANITLNKYALSNEERTSEIIYESRNTGGTKVNDDPTKNKYKSIPIKCNCLDKYIRDKNIKDVEIIKIDIEGHELQFFEGFKEGLDSQIAKYIFMELSPDLLGREKAKELCQNIINHNYDIYDLGHTMWANLGDNISWENKMNDKLDTIVNIDQTDVLFIRRDTVT